MFWVCLVCVPLYLVGIPAVWMTLLVILYRRKKLFSKDALSTFGFLFNTYRLDLWLWHIVTIIRMVGMQAVVAFSVGSEYQSSMFNSLLMALLALYAWVKPYAHSSTNFVSCLSIVVLMVSFNVLRDGSSLDVLVVIMTVSILVIFSFVLALPLLKLVSRRCTCKVCRTVKDFAVAGESERLVDDDDHFTY